MIGGNYEKRAESGRYSIVAEEGRENQSKTVLLSCKECGIVERSIASRHVLEALSELFLARGIPEFIRSDNGIERFNGTLRDELLNREAFYESFHANIDRNICMKTLK
jgi:hypothetical protein